MSIRRVGGGVGFLAGRDLMRNLSDGAGCVRPAQVISHMKNRKS
jgi:hypothetical protein